MTLARTPVPDDRARGRDVVSVVRALRLLFGEVVRERVAPLVEGKTHRLVAVGRVLQHRQHRANLGDGRYANPLGGRRAHRDAGHAMAAVEEELRPRSASGVAHDDRFGVELRDHAFEMLDDRRDRHLFDRGGVGVQSLHLDFEARIGRGDNPIALRLIVRDPALPGSWGDPKPVDKQDRVGR